MGYTNYWYQYRDFTDSEWDEISDFAYTLADNSEKYKINVLEIKDRIVINGDEGGSCETFILNRYEPEPRYEGDKTYFNFCKTLELPYDKVVWKFLKFIKFVVLDPNKADFIISNDNGDEFVSISDTVTLDTSLGRDNFDRAYKWTQKT